MTQAAERALLRRLLGLVDASTPAVAAKVEKALLALARSVSISELERIIVRRDAFGLHDLVRGLPKALQSTARDLERVFKAGLDAGTRLVPNAVLRFAVMQPEAIQAARTAAATLVTNVTNETRLAIRTVVAQSFAEGIAPRETAQLIQPLIGLSTRQAVAVEAYRKTQIARGVAKAMAAERAKRYATEQLKKRAMLIARTETIGASVRGQLSAWRSARQAGLLGQGARKVWIVTPDDRLCRRCQALEGVTIPLDSAFERFTLGPPLHPACRCALGLVPVSVGARRAA